MNFSNFLHRVEVRFVGFGQFYDYEFVAVAGLLSCIPLLMWVALTLPLRIGHQVTNESVAWYRTVEVELSRVAQLRTRRIT